MFPPWTLPDKQCPKHSKEGCPALVNNYGPAPLQLNRCPEQRNRAKMKEQSKSSERELSDREIAKLSDGEFKALAIKMLTELIELGRKMKKQMKDTQNEVKQNVQGTNSEGKEAKSTIWNKWKKSNRNRMKKQEFKNVKRG